MVKADRHCLLCEKKLYPLTKGAWCRKCYYLANPGSNKRGSTKHTAESIAKMRVAHTGHKHSEEVKTRIGAAHVGLKRTTEACANMKAAQAKRDPSSRKHGRPDPQLISERRKAEWALVPKHERAAKIADFTAAGNRACKKASATKPELTVRSILDDLGLKYQVNQRMGIYNVDLISDKHIIECFGDYWHCTPTAWPAERYNRSLRMTAGEKWEKDQLKVEYLQQQGFAVLVLWEGEIMRATESVREAIRVFLGLPPGGAA